MKVAFIVAFVAFGQMIQGQKMILEKHPDMKFPTSLVTSIIPNATKPCETIIINYDGSD